MNPSRPRFMTLRNKGPNGELSLLCVMKDMIKDVIVIRDESTFSFTTWRNYDLQDLYDELGAKNLSYHEVIIPEKPQRIRLDIDIDVNSPEFEALRYNSLPLGFLTRLRIKSVDCRLGCKMSITSCKCTHFDIARQNMTTEQVKAQFILENIISAYKEVLQYDYVLCCSNRPGKYSYHLISTAYVTDASTGHYFARKIHDKIDPRCQAFNDIGVSSVGGHNLRMTHCIKPGKPESKKRIIKALFEPEQFDTRIRGSNKTRWVQWRESFVTYISDCCRVIVLPTYITNIKPSSGPQPNEMPNDKVELVHTKFPGTFYSGKNGDRFDFKRIAPGYCSLCNRQHEKDNMFAKFFNGKYYLRCWRDTHKFASF